MRGDGTICLKIGQHSFHEHFSLDDAKTEAKRLATELGAVIVIYAPIIVVEPPRVEAKESVVSPDGVAGLRRWFESFDDLPF